MAGYIFNLSDRGLQIEEYISQGIYGPFLSQPSGYWSSSHEGTFADFATMRSGDSLFFFQKRKLYGVGRIKSVLEKGDCCFLNYSAAMDCQDFSDLYTKISPDIVLDVGEESTSIRLICCFEPAPFFFLNGVDMDEALASSPGSFRMLRAFWKLSFVKIDEKEEQALKDIILRRNEEFLSGNAGIFKWNRRVFRTKILKKLSKGNHQFSLQSLIKKDPKGQVTHEMALEARILFDMTHDIPNKVSKTFGQWDFLSHQVVASPFKPIDYMDKIDIFGYRYIKGHLPTVSKYLVMENKKGPSSQEDVDQIMKYVDWVCQEYAKGDYSLIKAFLVAFGHTKPVQEKVLKEAVRQYSLWSRPVRQMIWDDLTLVEYPSLGI